MLGNWSVPTGQLPHRTNSPQPYIISYKFDINSTQYTGAIRKTKGFSGAGRGCSRGERDLKQQPLHWKQSLHGGASKHDVKVWYIDNDIYVNKYNKMNVYSFFECIIQCGKKSLARVYICIHVDTASLVRGIT